jgi:uncharacterized protein (DUF111 family)
MFLVALVDAGVPAKLFEDTVAALNIGARLEISQVDRGGITATKLDVYVHGEVELPRELFWAQKDHAREHEHEHGHKHDHSNDHEHDPVELKEHNYSQARNEGARAGAAPHEHKHEHGRGLKEIREVIRKADISDRAKSTTTAMFEVGRRRSQDPQQ